MALTWREAGRKTLHMGMGFFALALKSLTWQQAAGCALLALIHNLFILPKTARFALRDGRLDAGIILYPLSVLFLILIFRHEMALAAAAWGYLAFGDGMATVVGKSLPIKRFCWSGGKSLGGAFAFALFGGIGSNLLYNTVGSHTGRHPMILFAAALLALFELLPMPINDNLTLPLLGAVLLLLLPTLHSMPLPTFTAAAWALGINILLALVAYLARFVSLSAFTGGVFVGTLILLFGGAPAFVSLLLFFILASLATRLGYRRKAAGGMAQEAGGRRGARHALANGFVPLFLSVCLYFSPDPLPLRLALAAALATALADTLGSELGQIWGKRPIHPLTFRQVPPGTEGAVSMEGTLAGIAGALLLALLPLCWHWYGIVGVIIVVAAAFLGSTVESLLGVLGKWDNEVLNFTNTLIGALIAAGLALGIGSAGFTL